MIKSARRFVPLVALAQASDGDFDGTTYFGGGANFGYGYGPVFKSPPTEC